MPDHPSEQMLSMTESSVRLPQEGRLLVPGAVEAGSCACSSKEPCSEWAGKLACWKG